MRGIAILNRIGAARSTSRHALAPLLFLTIAAFFAAPDNVTLNKLYYALVAPLMLLALRTLDYQFLWRHTSLRWSAAFVAFMTLSAAWSSGESSEPMRVIALHGASTMAFVLLISASQRSWLDRLPAWCASVVTLHILTISAVWYTTHPLTDPLEGIGRLDHPLELASVYAAMAGMCLMRYLQAPSRQYAVYLVAVVACVVAILLTGRRGPLLAFGAVALLTVTRHRGAQAVWTLASLLIGVAALLALVPSLTDELLTRGTSLRPEIWLEAWQRLRHDGAWIFGNGLGSSAALEVNGLATRHYHNVFFATLFYGGVIGTALLCGLLAATVSVATRAAAAQPWLAAFYVGFGCLLTNGDRLVIHPHPVWLYFWLPGTLVAIYAGATAGTGKPVSVPNDPPRDT